MGKTCPVSHEQSAKIPDLVAGAPDSYQAMLRAYQWLVDLRAGAKAALYDSELAAVLETRYRIPSLDSLMAKYQKKSGLSSDELYTAVVQDIKGLFQTRYPEQVGGCFIAGTLVHTDKGLVPIEQIKVGDMVLSQPEQGGRRRTGRW